MLLSRTAPDCGNKLYIKPFTAFWSPAKPANTDFNLYLRQLAPYLAFKGILTDALYNQVAEQLLSELRSLPDEEADDVLDDSSYVWQLIFYTVSSDKYANDPVFAKFNQREQEILIQVFCLLSNSSWEIAAIKEMVNWISTNVTGKISSAQLAELEAVL